jgi:hypothetical protein
VVEAPKDVVVPARRERQSGEGGIGDSSVPVGLEESVPQDELSTSGQRLPIYG